MHFITENELRTKFRKEAFKQFSLVDDERLTPEAKQFLSDKKIELVTLKAKDKNILVTDSTAKLLIGYREIVSAELLEAAVLGMKQQIAMSQKLLQLEQKVVRILSSEPEEHSTVEENLVVQLDAVHIFSDQGLLLIKLKKISGLVCLIQSTFPKYNNVLIEITQEISGIVNQLIGETDE